jgi:ribose 5-phosphate isomerase B
MKIFLASDHAGFDHKETIKNFLTGLGYEVRDFGAYEYGEFDDYPDFIMPLAEELSKNPEGAKAVIFGGSGEGEAMAANRFKGVRAAVYYGGQSAIIKLSRTHNNANVLSLGARFVGVEEAKGVIKTWLETEFLPEERHERRISKLDS